MLLATNSIVFLTVIITILGSVTAQLRIVNGTDAITGEFPFIASLRRSLTGSHSCGCAILNEFWLLTAAHCIVRATPQRVNVQYGLTEITRNDTNVANVSRLVIHEGYNRSNRFIHDIGLIKLQNPISFDELVQPIRLPEQNQDTAENTSVTLIGWGLDMSGGSIQKNLQKVTLQTFSDKECYRRLSNATHPTNICAGVPEGGKGQCSGDSGGPLVLNGTQIGIVSWSIKPCTIAPYPGVFTEVSAYVDWIHNVINEDAEDEINSI